MPHFICRWPGGDVLLASVESRQELDAILQERCEPGVCKVARYHGPLVLELKPDVPGVPRASAERFAPAAPACPAFAAAAATRLSTGDVDLLAADGSRQRVHKLVLQCRLPVLQGQPVPAEASQVRLPCVPDSRCLLSLVQYLYLDDVSRECVTAALHCAALRCGLQRLVELCEAQFSQHLELQLVSWPGLDEAQRAGVLDSFIGWTLYAEQLGRRELHELCVHAMARHWAAAQSRPSWSSLSADTASLVQLVAASTAPPIIHRQVLPDGSAILPVPHNPGPAAAAAAATAAAAAGQAGVQPPPSIVSVDAEAFAAAGGRMTMWEWQQLQAFREAVCSSKSRPEASPLCLTTSSSSSGGLASSSSGGLASSSSGDGSTRSFSAAAPGLSFSVKQPLLGPHKRLMDSVCRFAFPATHGLLTAGWKPAGTEEQQQQQGAGGAAPPASAAASAPGQQVAGSSTAAGFAGLAAIAAATQAVQARQPAGRQQAPPGSSGLSLPVPAPSTVHQQRVSGVQAAINSLGGAPPPRQQQQAQPAGRAQPELQGRVSSSMPGSFPTSAALRMRVAAAAGAAAGPQQQRGSLGEVLARLQARESWGSGVSSAALGASMPPAQEQQHQEEKGRESWGSGVPPPREQSGAGSLSSGRGSEPSGSVITQLCHHLATGLEPAQAAQQQQQHGHSEAGSDAGTAPDPQQQQNQPMLLEGAASVAGGGAHWQAACSQAGAGEAARHQGVLDLPDMWQPPPAAASSSRSSNGGGRVALWGAASTPAPASGGAAPTPDASAGGSSAQGSECPVSSMQRALVEDFVLYEEASAARQHVVGILVAIEQGDVAAGQRLLAPACAELIAATAPAVVPNRLAPLLSAPGVIATAAAATAAGLPTADAAAAVTLSAAAEFCQQVHGVGKLLGSAASSRAALEATPLQLRQQRQRQQQLLLQGLQQVSSRLPWLSRLVQPTQQQAHSAAPPAAAAAGVQQSAAGEDKQATQQQQQPDMDMPPQPASSEGGTEPPAAAADTEAALQQEELRAAVVELIMQLPELLHGAPGPALLTQEQYGQRSSQAQQLAVQAMQLLAPGDGAGAGSTAGAGASADASISNELAASGLLAAASAVMAATQGLQAGDAAAAAGVMAQLQQQHASQLFAAILESLRVPAPAAGGAGNRPPGLELPSSAAAGAAAFAASSGGSFLSRAAAFAAANRLAEGLVTGRQSFGALGAGSLGLTRGASIAGAGQLGAWRLPAAGAAAAAGLLTPAGGMFAPTGAGALLSGGLLAEGGVAGDSILDDMLHSNVRRITCHGLYELCAALAAPVDVPMPLAAASPPPPQQQTGQALRARAPQEEEQEQEGMQLEGVSIASIDGGGNGSSFAARAAGAAAAAAGHGAALAAAAGAAGTSGGGSSRCSSNSSSMGPPPNAHKRRASSTDDENDRALKR